MANYRAAAAEAAAADQFHFCAGNERKSNEGEVVAGFIENSPFDTSWHGTGIDRLTTISLLQEPIELH